MKCKNCGANYKTRELKCPYCNTENIVGKLWQTERTQAELDYEKEKNKVGKIIFSPYMFDRLISRAMYVLIILHIVSIAAIFLVALGSYGWQELRFALNQAEIEAQMEEYYTAGEYEKLDVYMEGYEAIYGYNTYNTATSMNWRYNEYLENRLNFDQLSEEEKRKDDYYLKYALNYSAQVYNYEFDIYGKYDKNAELKADYQKEIMAYWLGELELTAEEIEMLTSEAKYSYYDEAEIIAGNVKDRRGKS